MKRFGMLLGLFLLIAVPCFALSGSGGSSGGGGTTITSGAGDFGAATAQSGAVLTGVVTGLAHVTSQTAHQIQLGETTGLGGVAVGTTNQILIGQTGADPIWATALPAAAFPALTGDVTTTAGSLATTAVGSSNLQQPVMFIGGNTATNFGNGTTTGTIPSPIGVLNGMLELVFISINNATSATFVPPTGWTAVPSCASAGNGVQLIAFQHVAASEGGTIAAFTWTGNGVGEAWAVAFNNTTAVDTCTASTAASASTFTTTGITAAATSDRIVVVGAQPLSGGFIGNTSVPKGLSADSSDVSNTSYGEAEFSYPITSTTVAGFGFTSGVTQAWAGATIGLAFTASSTAGPPGALTYGQSNAYLTSLILGQTFIASGGNIKLAYSLLLPIPTGSPNVYGIAGYDNNGIIRSAFSVNGNALIIGDSNANNSGGFSTTVNGNTTINGTLGATNHAITTTTAAISSTTGAIGPTGGGVLQSYGGTLPTCACTGGTPTCTAQTGASNTAGQLVTTGGTAMTTCTLTFSASGPFHAAPVCVFTDANANIAPVPYSTGAVSTSTAVYDFAAANSNTVNYICIGH